MNWSSENLQKLEAALERLLSLLDRFESLIVRSDAEWYEEDHPRGQPENAGQFGPGGGKVKSEKSAKSAKSKPTTKRITVIARNNASGEYSEHVANVQAASEQEAVDIIYNTVRPTYTIERCLGYYGQIAPSSRAVAAVNNVSTDRKEFGFGHESKDSALEKTVGKLDREGARNLAGAFTQGLDGKFEGTVTGKNASTTEAATNITLTDYGTELEYNFFREGDGPLQMEIATVVVKDTGKGLGKIITKNAIKVALDHGVSKVSLHANMDVGGYAWAKFGFIPTQDTWDELRLSLTKRAKTGDIGSQWSDDERGEIMGLLENADPRSIWALSDHPRGHGMLLNTSWHGTLDTDDNPTKRRFHDYVTKEKTGG